MIGQREMPSVVYHYTSMQNLVNILESGQLWATHINYLNDVKERRLLLNAAIARAEHFCDLNALKPELLKHVLKMEMQARKIDELPFVVSFTKHRNSLAQWRSYCSKGNGVSIGFLTEKLRNDPFERLDVGERNGFVPDSTFGAVRYLNDLDMATLDEILQTALTDVRKYLPKMGNLPHEEVLTMRLQALASFIKHKSFHAEAEYRLLVQNVNMRVNGDLLGARATATTLVPFVRVPLVEVTQAGENRLPIREIVVGPCPNPDLSVQAIRFLVSKHRLDVRVRDSESPYRDL